MPKKVFWPVSMVVMGLVSLASNMGYLPLIFADLWPVILIVVGLGGLITSDREEWLNEEKRSRTTQSKSAASGKSRLKKRR